MADQNFSCKVCNVIVNNQASYDDHVGGKRHLLAVHRKRMETCGVVVTGLPATIKDGELKQFFSQYGRIIYSKMNVGSSIELHFENENAVEKILSAPVKFEGKLLGIRKWINKSNVIEKKHVENFGRIKLLLGTIPDFDSQVDMLMQELHPSSHKIEAKCNHLCRDLTSALKERFPGCLAYLFGSSVSGLNFQDSDVDVFIELARPVRVYDEEDTVASLCVRQARNLLERNRFFTQIISIPKAKTPIVKCLHVPTGLNCDFNFKNKLGVFNSQLIRFLVGLDGRLRPLIMIVKFWAKLHELTGSGKLTNYALVMLIIFYLQQHPDPVLPPIFKLQQPQFTHIYEGWNVGFTHDARYIMPRPNNKTLLQLLEGFFKFYATYDASSCVISPLSGQGFLKSEFLKPDKLPKFFDCYKWQLNSNASPLYLDSVICVQDPFEQNHNICKSVSRKTFEDFKLYCKIGMQVFTKGLPKSILPQLFKSVIIEDVDLVSLNDRFNSIKVTSTHFPAQLVAKVAAAEDKQGTLIKLLFKEANELLLIVLEKIFYFETTAVSDSPNLKSQKVEGQSDIHDRNIIDSVKYRCTTTYNLWEARKSISRSLKLKGSQLEREIKISTYVVEELCKGLVLTDVILDCQISLLLREDPTEIELLLTNGKSRKNNFYYFCRMFCKLYLSLFQKYEGKLESVSKEEKALNGGENEKDVPGPSTRDC